jgi:hypothetical protein
MRNFLTLLLLVLTFTVSASVEVKEQPTAVDVIEMSNTLTAVSLKTMEVSSMAFRIEYEVLCEDPDSPNYITVNNDTGEISYWKWTGWFWGYDPPITISQSLADTICFNEWWD